MTLIKQLFPLTHEKLWKIINATSPEANDNLRKMMNHIGKIFFPGWNRNNSYSCYALKDDIFEALVSDGERFLEDGSFSRMAYFRCDPWKIKIIWARESLMIPDWESEMESVMIHEICHTLTFTGNKNKYGRDLSHGPSWQNRMYKCLRKARELGMDDLSFFILQSLETCMEFHRKQE